MSVLSSINWDDFKNGDKISVKNPSPNLPDTAVIEDVKEGVVNILLSSDHAINENKGTMTHLLRPQNNTVMKFDSFVNETWVQDAGPENLPDSVDEEEEE